MAISMRSGRRQQRGGGGGFRIRLSSQRRLFRTIIISLVFIAVVPPIFFHFRLKRLHQVQQQTLTYKTHIFF